ncbi:MAG: DUF692 family protein [Deltaproteobacteria bacterium]|nr:DUF692 family protein [Deltaproteobacteria bacterium]
MPSPLFGLGFRPRYFGDLVDARPRVDWLELVSENFMAVGGRTRQMLDRLAADYRLALHGVSLSIAGAAPLDEEHLAALRELADLVDPLVVSDHLCWTSWRGCESHDLLPIACTRAALEHVAARVAHVQERLGRRLVLENASAYVAFAGAEMDEAALLAALCARTGCGVLLDVNNLIVNAANLGDDPQRYLDALAPEDVVSFHVAGHRVLPDVRIDTHDAPVPDPVWALYRQACERFPHAHTILERDERLPSFDELVAELDLARRAHDAARRHAGASAGGSPAARPAVPPRRAPLRSRPAGGSSAPPATSWHAAFFDAVLGESTPPDALLSAATPVARERGLRVYREAYLSRLQHGLRDNFPTLAAVLGAARFDRLIADYVAAHPPRGWRFGAAGAALPAFVERYRFAAEVMASPAVLADLAAVEQAELEVHDAPDDGPALAPAALQTVAPEAWPGLRVAAGAACRLLRCRADVLPAIEAVAAGRTPLPPSAEPVGVLIGRQDGAVVRRRFDARQADIAARLLAGAPMLEASGGDAAQGAAAVVALATAGVLRRVHAAAD